MTEARRSAAILFGGLIVIGALWGLTTPLTKIAVSSGHGPFGLIVWIAVIDITCLAAVCIATGRRLDWSGAHLRLYAAVGLLGMVMPMVASYTAAPHLPSGVLSLVISLVPMFALPIALVLGMERLEPLRLLGVVLGAVAVALISRPTALGQGAWLFVGVAALAPLFYAIEGSYVSGRATRAADPVQTLLGSAIIALAVGLPLSLLTGQGISPLRVWAAPEWALAASGLLSVGAYAGYVWILRASGPVFAAQVSYLVTGFGVVWAMLVLGERYDWSFWVALATIFAGLFLVQPRPVAPPVAVPVPPAPLPPEAGV